MIQVVDDEGPQKLRKKDKANAFLLRVTLAKIEPPIWRRVWVSKKTSLHELHRMIQILFEWLDYHLYEFSVGEEKYEAPDEEAEGHDSTKARLSGLGLSVGDEIRYLYDFGDYWVHEIRIEDEDALDLDWLPHLVDGQRAGPPEDCGGVGGYERVLEALVTEVDEEDPDSEAAEIQSWVGSDFDPESFDVQYARHVLLLTGAWGALRRRR